MVEQEVFNMKEETGRRTHIYHVCKQVLRNLMFIKYFLLVDSDVNMNAIVTELLAAVVPNVPLKPTDDFHISLTKTVILRHHWIELFVESIKERITTVKR